MTYTPAQYAVVLAAVLRKKSAAERTRIAGRLFRHLLRTRVLTHRRRIMQEAARIMYRQEGIAAADIASAAPLGAGKRRMIGRLLGKKAIISETVDSRLLGGIRILIDDEILIDATASRRLATLFQP